MAEPAQAVLPTGLGWADVDGDGLEDLIVARADAALAVFQVGLIFWFRGNQSLVQVLSLGPHVKGKSSGGLGRSASTENMLGRGAQSGGAGDSGTQA